MLVCIRQRLKHDSSPHVASPPLQTHHHKMKTQLIFITVSVLEPVLRVCVCRPALFSFFCFSLDRLLQKHFIKRAAALRSLLQPPAVE